MILLGPHGIFVLGSHRSIVHENTNAILLIDNFLSYNPFIHIVTKLMGLDSVVGLKHKKIIQIMK